MKKHASPSYHMVLIALFAALIVVCGYVGKIPIGPLPITLQSLAVMLAGAALGPIRGSLAVMVVLLLAVIGIPTLASGAVGIAVVSDIMVGYRIGFIFGCLTTGVVVQAFIPFMQSKASRIAILFTACLLGLIVIHSCGILWAAWQYNTPWSELWKLWVLPFILPDAIKAVLATIIASSLMKFKILQP